MRHSAQEHKEIVKHKARFFEPETRSILDAILGGLKAFCGGIAIRELRPEDVVFRARLAGSHREADEWFKSPETRSWRSMFALSLGWTAWRIGRRRSATPPCQGRFSAPAYV